MIKEILMSAWLGGGSSAAAGEEGSSTGSSEAAAAQNSTDLAAVGPTHKNENAKPATIQTRGDAFPRMSNGKSTKGKAVVPNDRCHQDLLVGGPAPAPLAAATGEHCTTTAAALSRPSERKDVENDDDALDFRGVATVVSCSSDDDDDDGAFQQVRGGIASELDAEEIAGGLHNRACSAKSSPGMKGGERLSLGDFGPESTAATLVPPETEGDFSDAGNDKDDGMRSKARSAVATDTKQSVAVTSPENSLARKRGRTGFFATAVVIIKSSIGGGFLFLPHAVVKAGILLSFLTLTGVFLLALYCMTLLVWCCEACEESNRSAMDSCNREEREEVEEEKEDGMGGDCSSCRRETEATGTGIRSAASSRSHSDDAAIIGGRGRRGSCLSNSHCRNKERDRKFLKGRTAETSVDFVRWLLRKRPKFLSGPHYHHKRDSCARSSSSDESTATHNTNISRGKRRTVAESERDEDDDNDRNEKETCTPGDTTASALSRTFSLNNELGLEAADILQLQREAGGGDCMNNQLQQQQQHLSRRTDSRGTLDMQQQKMKKTKTAERGSSFERKPHQKKINADAGIKSGEGAFTPEDALSKYECRVIVSVHTEKTSNATLSTTSDGSGTLPGKEAYTACAAGDGEEDICGLGNRRGGRMERKDIKREGRRSGAEEEEDDTEEASTVSSETTPQVVKRGGGGGAGRGGNGGGRGARSGEMIAQTKKVLATGRTIKEKESPPAPTFKSSSKSSDFSSSSSSHAAALDSYEGIAHLACGTGGERLIETCVVVSQLSFAIVNVVLVAGNVRDVVWTAGNCSPAYNIRTEYFIWLAGLFYIPLCLIRKMKYLVRVALTANIGTAVGVLMLLVAVGLQLATQQINAPHQLQDLPLARWNNWPLILGTSVYLWEGAGLVLPIRQEAKEKVQKRYPAFLGGTLSFVLLFLLSFSLICTMAFREHVQILILFNLSSGPLTLALQAIFALAIMATYPILMFPALNIVERHLFKLSLVQRIRNKKRGLLVIYGLRVLFALSTLAIATLGMRQLDDFVALVGGLCGAPLVFVFPVYFHMRLVKQKFFQKIFHYFVIVTGVFIQIFSVYWSIATWKGSSEFAARCLTAPL